MKQFKVVIGTHQQVLCSSKTSTSHRLSLASYCESQNNRNGAKGSPRILIIILLYYILLYYHYYYLYYIINIYIIIIYLIIPKDIPYYTQRFTLLYPKIQITKRQPLLPTMITMKFFINELFFLGFLLLSATTPTLNNMKRRSNGLKSGRICYLVFAISIEPLKKVSEGNIIKHRILKSGNVESNPGPQIIYKLLTQLFIRNRRKLKFIHINCQSLNKKHGNLKEPMGDLGQNTIYGITETWLGELDEAKLWEMNENFKLFRCYRKSDFKERGGGVMLAVHKSLNPKEREY